AVVRSEEQHERGSSPQDRQGARSGNGHHLLRRAQPFRSLHGGADPIGWLPDPRDGRTAQGRGRSASRVIGRRRSYASERRSPCERGARPGNAVMSARDAHKEIIAGFNLLSLAGFVIMGLTLALN